MVLPLAFWMSLNSWVRLAGTVIFAVHVLAAFQQQQGCHHLGQAGHIPLLVGVLFQNGFVDVGVEQIDRLASRSVWMGMWYAASPGRTRVRASAAVSSRAAARRKNVLHKRILQRKLPASMNQKLKHYIKRIP